MSVSVVTLISTTAIFPPTGSDTAATDAGQVPDHVRSDHWKEYPNTSKMLNISCILFLYTNANNYRLDLSHSLTLSSLIVITCLNQFST